MAAVATIRLPEDMDGDRVTVDIAVIRFASIIKKFRPKYYDLGFGRMPYHILGATA